MSVVTVGSVETVGSPFHLVVIYGDVKHAHMQPGARCLPVCDAWLQAYRRSCHVLSGLRLTT